MRNSTAIVIGSGKGGVGKSVLAALLAAHAARSGRRTLLFDASYNQGNQHLLLGQVPRTRLDAVLGGSAAPWDLLLPVDTKLTLLPADSGSPSCVALSELDRARLYQRLVGVFLDFDVIVVDTGPGAENTVRAALSQAARLVVVAAPEPTALSDAYALVKMTHLRAPHVGVDVIVNRVASSEQAERSFGSLAVAAERFLHRELAFAGAVIESESLRRAACRPGALLSVRMDSVAAVAERVLASCAAATNTQEEAVA
jgi:flagellar biosynthesis protein FlhG